MGIWDDTIGRLLPGLGESQDQFNNKVARQYAGGQANAAGLRAQGYQQQYQQYAGQSEEALRNAGGYANQAAGLYGTLGGYGSQDRNAYLQSLQQLLPLYAGYAGLPSAAGQSPYGAGGVNSTPGANPYGAGTPNLNVGRTGPGAAQGTGRDPQLQSMIDAAAGRGQTPLPGYAPQRTGASVPPVTGVNAPEPQGQSSPAPSAPDNQSAFDPYAMTPAQQQQLNAQVDQYRNAESSALADYRAQYAARGMTPPPEGEAMIREHFGAQGQQAKAAFAENARAAGQQAAGNLLSMFGQLNPQAASETGNAAAGYGNVGGQYQGISSGFGQLGGQAMTGSAQEQGLGLQYTQLQNQLQAQQAAQNQAAYAALLGAAGTWAGGGFAPRPTIPGVGGNVGGPLSPGFEGLQEADRTFLTPGLAPPGMTAGSAMSYLNNTPQQSNYNIPLAPRRKFGAP